jgi:hypothetical protein
MIEIVVINRAVEIVRLAGAPLVNEHDVTISMDSLKGVSRGCIERRRGHSRATGEHEQRIRLFPAVDGRNAGYAEGDVPTGGVGRILGNAELAAFGQNDGDLGGILQLTGLQCQPRRTRSSSSASRCSGASRTHVLGVSTGRGGPFGIVGGARPGRRLRASDGRVIPSSPRISGDD